MALKTKIKSRAYRPSTASQTRAKKNIHTAKLLLMSFVFFIALAPIAQARTFNPHDLLSDEGLYDKNSLSKTAIQKFLVRKNSVLSRFSQIVEGRTLTAAEMIWEVSQKHGVNPKFLMATLEKEQSLLSRAQATDRALDWATGYGCFGGGCQEKHRGFYNQVEATAETQIIYTQRKNEFNYRVGETSLTLDGFALTPANQATANQYIYTPYVGYSPELGVTKRVGGNRLFWRIWNRYFTDQKFLDGQVLRNGSNYYLIENNAKRAFASQDIFMADYKDTDAIVVGQKELNAYPNGPTVSFPNNTVVQSNSADQLYLLTDGIRRPITNETTALALLDEFRIAINTDQIIVVSESQIANYPIGSLITSAATFPQGRLVRGSNGQIWLIRDNLKHAVDNAVWQHRYDNLEPAAAPDNIESLPTGRPILFKDGTFVTVNNKYYLISQGARMKIEDHGLFNRVFGPNKQQNAVSVSTALLQLHEAGEIIEYIDDTIRDPVSSPAVAAPIGNFAASFTQMLPDGLIMLTGKTAQVSLVFTNTGSAAWGPGDVWLEMTDRNADTTVFGVAENIGFAEGAVASGQSASFAFDVVAPSKAGLHTQNFTLYANQGGQKTQIAQIGKFIIIKPSEGGQILEHNLPIAVVNTWRPLPITVKIKNTSVDETWLSSKTALEVYNADSSPSSFYDPNDWIRRAVAAVPINKSTIGPGEVGEFKFTIDPRGLARGTYDLVFTLKLLDRDKQVLLDGGDNWVRLIRVD